MRILWLTVDRDHRVAQIFEPLRDAMCEIEDVTVVSHNQWSVDSIRGTAPRSIQLDPVWVNEFDVLFTDAPFGYMAERWDQVKIPKCCLVEDCHGDLPAIYVRVAAEVGFEHFFCRYRDGFDHHFPDIDARWLPHSIDPDVFFPGKGETDEVLAVGRTGTDTYPLRGRVIDELSGMPWFRNVDRPEEGQANPWPVRVDYANLLRDSKIVISGCSKYGYPILKTFEIPACGAVLASDHVAEMTALGFLPAQTMIALGPGPIAEQLQPWLVDDQMRCHVARAGAQLVHAHHTAHARARRWLQPALQRIVKKEGVREPAYAI